MLRAAVDFPTLGFAASTTTLFAGIKLSTSQFTSSSGSCRRSPMLVRVKVSDAAGAGAGANPACWYYVDSHC
jgi:hypothetical protein